MFVLKLGIYISLVDCVSIKNKKRNKHIWFFSGISLTSLIIKLKCLNVKFCQSSEKTKSMPCIKYTLITVSYYGRLEQILGIFNLHKTMKTEMKYIPVRTPLLANVKHILKFRHTHCVIQGFGTCSLLLRMELGVLSSHEWINSRPLTDNVAEVRVIQLTGIYGTRILKNCTLTWKPKHILRWT
jgi:hypothetical protein